MPKIGIGYDIHRLEAGRRLVLGGLDIPFSAGLFGHSDGDALVHAVMDALLGALGESDIGAHFPDTDPQYKGARSIGLLDEVVGLVRERGGEIANVDAVIVAEETESTWGSKSVGWRMDRPTSRCRIFAISWDSQA